jgi:hypothetical protein
VLPIVLLPIVPVLPLLSIMPLVLLLPITTKNGPVPVLPNLTPGGHANDCNDYALASIEAPPSTEGRCFCMRRLHGGSVGAAPDITPAAA